MGMRGTGEAVSLWGRVSTYIIHHAKAPVLTVPEINKYKGFGKIMLAVDFSENNVQLVHTLLETFQRFDSRLCCVHFSVKGHKQDDKAKMDALMKLIRKEEGNGSVSFEVVDMGKDHKEAINTYVAGNNIDMIAFQPHRHSIFYALFNPNITRKDLTSTKIPILAIPL
jgi:K+-sensing histidine kinase KdpD